MVQDLQVLCRFLNPKPIQDLWLFMFCDTRWLDLAFRGLGCRLHLGLEVSD